MSGQGVVPDIVGGVHDEPVGADCAGERSATAGPPPRQTIIGHIQSGRSGGSR